MKPTDTAVIFSETDFGQTKNPMAPADLGQVLSDLSISRREISEGKGIDAEEALLNLGRENGYI